MDQSYHSPIPSGRLRGKQADNILTHRKKKGNLKALAQDITHQGKEETKNKKDEGRKTQIRNKQGCNLKKVIQEDVDKPLPKPSRDRQELL